MLRAAGPLILAMAGCRTISAACEPARAFRPWDAVPAARQATPEDRMPARDLPDALIAFYQGHMRAAHLPGAGCRLRPTCSLFARRAFQKWSALGFVLVADRLFVREHPFM